MISLGDGANWRRLDDETSSSRCYMRLNLLIAGNFETHCSETLVIVFTELDKLFYIENE